MKNTKSRKKYDADFKRNAVELVLNGHRTCRSVERDLDIGQGILHRWIDEYGQDPKRSFSGNGRKKTVQVNDEVVMLHKEIETLKMERDILKKALAIFSMGQGRFTHS
jgi:transposase